ncbi:MAG TPA: PEP/pyruvate-binding domain-containing protein [Dehalococcoidia bacterium]|nr:PEP/pyruvate-binding domain-containing protein [Dehalococcoidia bacterium]
MPTEQIIALDNPAAREASVAGEKAAALARLAQQGLPVPGGFVVHADASVDVTAAIAPQIESLLTNIDQNVRALDEASSAIQRLIEGLSTPPELRTAIAAAYARLGDGAVVAVRSSGTAEDLPGASFAGQYDSFLNVSGVDALVGRVTDVWASLYSSHAIAYRRDAELPLAGVKMAVLVQEQLAADAAGVLFTRDPISGASDRMTVNVALGLGEGVVAGDVSADTFALDAGSLSVIERRIAEKTSMMTPAADGGIELRDVPATLHSEPALTDAQLADLGRLAQAVQQHEGGHRDIEFAVVDGDVRLLQARPITGLDDGAPDDVEWEIEDSESTTWFLGAGWGVARPVMTFERDIQLAYSVGAARVFAETGLPMPRMHILTFVNGYAYMRSPDVSGKEIQERMAASARFRAEFEREGEDYFFDEIESEVLGHLERLGPFRRPAKESLEDRLGFLEQALASYSHVLGDLHWRQLRGVDINPKTRVEWPPVFSELTGLPELDGGTQLQGVDNKTVRMVRRLRGLARIAQDDRKLRAALEAREFDAITEEPLRSRPVVKRFRSRFSALLRDYGRRSGRSFGSATSMADPTWNLDHAAPLALVASYVGQDLDELDRREREAREERVAGTRNARALVAPESRPRFDSALKLAHHNIRAMENHNAIMEQGVSGVMREAIWWMGQALVRDGRLDAPDDAMHLSLDELRAIADGSDDRELRAAVAERKALLDHQSTYSPPRSLGIAPPAGAGLLGPQSSADGDSAGLDGSILRGTAASRGRHAGLARVYAMDGNRPEVEPGDILVAKNAGQDWTPILSLLGGIVLDEGEVFQHAALVAREYRIPAVIQTREGTKSIRDGQTITVDGSEGIVELSP